MKANFDQSLKLVLVHEGGYSNHPKDPGGATMNGVIQRVYDAYRKSKNQPVRSVKELHPTERTAIYRKQYWDAIKGDQLPAGVDYVVFDGAVNSGPSQSIKWLQRALNINADGVIGQITLTALKNVTNLDRLIDDICNRRLAFMKALKTWSTFGKGWSRRVEGVRSQGKAFANHSVPVALAATLIVAEEGIGAAKAYLIDAKPLPSKAPGDIATGTGFGSTALTQITDQLSVYTNFPAVTEIVLIITVIGLLVGLGGLAYRWYTKRKENELKTALDLPDAAVSA